MRLHARWAAEMARLHRGRHEFNTGVLPVRGIALSHARDDRIDLALRSHQADSGAQVREGEDTGILGGVVWQERSEQFGFVEVKRRSAYPEGCRQDSNDCAGSGLYADPAAQRAWISVEHTLPQSVAQNDHITAAGSLFFRQEVAASSRYCAERCQPVRLYVVSAHAFRPARPVYQEPLAPVGGETLKATGLIVDIENPAWQTKVASSLRLVHSPEINQTIRIWSPP